MGSPMPKYELKHLHSWEWCLPCVRLTQVLKSVQRDRISLRALWISSKNDEMVEPSFNVTQNPGHQSTNSSLPFPIQFVDLPYSTDS